MSCTWACLPETLSLAVIVDVWVDETFFPVTVDVAALELPVEVGLLAGEIVAAPLAVHVTVRFCSRRPWLSSTTAVAVVVAFFLIVVFCRVRVTLATVPFVTVIVELPDFPPLLAVIVAVPVTPPVTSTL